MKFTNEDIKLIERFIEIKNKGMYCDGRQLTEVYNRVLERSVAVTNCGSCLRNRVQELENAYNAFKASLTASKDEVKEESSKEENKAAETMKERMARVRAAKGKKK